MEQNREPRNKSMHIQSTNFPQRFQQSRMGESIISLIDCVGTTRYSHVKTEIKPLF